MEYSVPEGFVSVDDAIKLIEKDTRKIPVVDTAFMVRNYNYTRVGGNFTIPLLQRDSSGRIIKKGETFVQFPDEESLYRFRGALKRHYKEVSGGMEVNENRVRSFSTAIDPEENPTGRITVNKKPMTKAGESLGSGAKTVKE